MENNNMAHSNTGSVTNKVKQSLHNLADIVHARTRPLGLPDGTATASIVAASTLMVGAPLIVSVAAGTAAAKVARNFGAASAENIDNGCDSAANVAINFGSASTENIDNEFEILIALRRILINIMHPKLSWTSACETGSFVWNNRAVVNDIKDSLVNSKPINPTVMLIPDKGHFIIFTDNTNRPKIAALSTMPNPQGNQINVFSLSDLEQFSELAPTRQQFNKLAREIMQVKADPATGDISIIKSVCSHQLLSSNRSRRGR